MPEKIKKKIKNNDYILTEDSVWVRNFCTDFPGVNLNSMISKADVPLLLNNELTNFKARYPGIDSEQIQKRNVIIISDGPEFKNRHKLLSQISGSTIIATNGSLNKWELIGDNCPASQRRAIGYYVVNNPYEDCMHYLPKKTRYYPHCIASTRTNPKFLQEYKGLKYLYSPTSDSFFSGPEFNFGYTLDDYRNPVCAAINLAVKFRAEKILLFSCDDYFEEKRSGTIMIDDVWCYPQQLMSHRIIDSCLYWLSQAGITTGYHSDGPKFNHAAYITEDKLNSFFEEEHA